MENGVMMQYFEWNLPNDGMLWKRLKDDASHLHEIGISAVWIPPAYKGHEQADEGYGTYDLYDLGEFDQKGTIRTKYGTKQELQEMIEELHRNQIGVYLDAVMNHKAGADYTEWFMAQEVDPGQRENATSEPHEIEGWTGFDFPGRGNMYSNFKWHWFHFSGTDYDVSRKKDGIFQILGEGKHWSEGVDDENGNYDYLMFADLDLFDVALHYNLNEASEKGRDYDLRDLLKGTLVEICPDQAVTFVDNHDSQKNSSLESQVKDWFKPSAYGLILLMKKGYPCIFYGDYYGVKGKKSPHRKVLDMLLRARKEYAYGEEVDYFDHPNTIGFVRLGDLGHADSGLAVVISNGEDGEKTMSVGENRKGEVWHEITGSVKDTVAIDEEGKGRFLVKGGKLAVWVKA